MNPLEALADAIQHHEGWFPGSRSYRQRNPGNLRVTDPAQFQIGGYRAFDSLLLGYAALLSDLRHKFTGLTITGLGPDSTLLDFFNVYAPAEDHNDPTSYAADVLTWLNKALGKQYTFQTTLKEIWQP